MDLFAGNADVLEYLDNDQRSGKRKRFGHRLKKLWTWVRKQNGEGVDDSQRPQRPGSGTPEDIKRLSAQLLLPDRSLARRSRDGRSCSPEPGQTISLGNSAVPRPRPRSSTTPPPIHRISAASSNLSDSEAEWQLRPPPRKRAATTDRVSKPIRMRVHYYCHLCGSNLSGNSVCSNSACQHRRCSKCRPDPDTRPLRTDEINAVVARELEERDPSNDNALPVPKLFATTLPLGGLPPGKRPPTPRRIRCICARICHRCSTPFVTAEHLCLECGHILCLKCPKDPPQARPRSPVPRPAEADPLRSEPISPRPSTSNSCLSERVHRRPRLRVKYQCEMCNAFFDEHSKTCVCGHVRCNTCPRDPPRRGSDVSSRSRPSTSPAVSNAASPRTFFSTPTSPSNALPQIANHHIHSLPQSHPSTPNMPISSTTMLPPPVPPLPSQWSFPPANTPQQGVYSAESFVAASTEHRAPHPLRMPHRPAPGVMV